MNCGLIAPLPLTLVCVQLSGADEHNLYLLSRSGISELWADCVITDEPRVFPTAHKVTMFIRDPNPAVLSLTGAYSCTNYPNKPIQYCIKSSCFPLLPPFRPTRTWAL